MLTLVSYHYLLLPRTEVFEQMKNTHKIEDLHLNTHVLFLFLLCNFNFIEISIYSAKQCILLLNNMRTFLRSVDSTVIQNIERLYKTKIDESSAIVEGKLSLCTV